MIQNNFFSDSQTILEIVVYQFVYKIGSEEKMLRLKKMGPPWSRGMREYVESVLRTRKTHGKKYTICINTISGNVHIVGPLF